MVYKTLDPFEQEDPHAKETRCCLTCFWFPLRHRSRHQPDLVPLDDDCSIDSLLSEIKRSSGASVTTQSTSSATTFSFNLFGNMNRDDMQLLGDTDDDDNVGFDLVPRDWDDPHRDEAPLRLEFRPYQDYSLKPGETIRITLPIRTKQKCWRPACGGSIRRSEWSPAAVTNKTQGGGSSSSQEGSDDGVCACGNNTRDTKCSASTNVRLRDNVKDPRKRISNV